MAKLSFDGGGEPRELSESDVCRIGRDPGNEVPLDDTGSSRRHCRISHDGRDWVLEDLQSANGTYRNEERIDRVKLVDGDVIRVGKTEMTFSVAEGGAPTKAAPARKQAPAAAAPGVEDAGDAGDAGDEGGEIVLEGAEPAGAAPFELLFARGERAGERIPLRDDRVTFGRKSSNTVALKDAKVSGVHCEVVLEGGRPVLRDLGSTNGTFLEGKRIDEIVLDHGDRVVVGDNEFVLADSGRPAVDMTRPDTADVGQTMLNIPKPEVVRDTTQAPKKKGGLAATLGLVALLVALGGAGWFYWDVQRKAAPPEAPPPQTGNLLGLGWSFEIADDASDGASDPQDAWLFSAPDGASFDVASSGARSGLHALRARPDGKSAHARMKAGLKTSGRNYRLSAYVKCSGDAVGVMSAAFGRADDPSYEVIVPIDSSAEGAWAEVTGDVVAPSGATHLAVILTGVGTGDVHFDDVGVFDTGVARPPATTVNQFEFERTGEGLFVTRGDELLRVGPFTCDAADQSFDVGRHLAQDKLVVAAGATVGYAAGFTPQPRGAEWRVEWQAAGSVTAVEVPLLLLPALTEEPVGVVRGSTLEPYLDRIDADGVDGLVLGRGATRLRLAFQPAVRVEGARNGDVTRLSIRPPVAAGRLAITVQVDFVEEKTEAAELASGAREAQRAGRLGQALEIVARITNEFPFDEALTADAESRRNEILRERDRIEQSLAATMERAQFLGSPAAYREAEAEARAAAAAFDGTAAAEAFRAREVELAAARRTIVQSSKQRAADLLLARLETALARGEKRVAKEIADHLTSRYPDSESAGKAKRLVGG